MSAVLLAASRATIPDITTYVICTAVVLVGAIGVVTSRNPVHAALSLVLTLFGIAVLFIEQNAQFLAAVQVIVYAGAIVVLFLFVIMFLGVDRRENIEEEPLKGQRPLAFALMAVVLGCVLALAISAHWVTGAHHVAGTTTGPGTNVAKLGRSVFTTYLFAFEATAALLVIAVVGAVVLARRPPGPARDDEEEEAERDPSEPEGATGQTSAEPVGPGAGGDPTVTDREAATHEAVAPSEEVVP